MDGGNAVADPVVAKGKKKKKKSNVRFLTGSIPDKTPDPSTGVAKQQQTINAMGSKRPIATTALATDLPHPGSRKKHRAQRTPSFKEQADAYAKELALGQCYLQPTLSRTMLVAQSSGQAFSPSADKAMRSESTQQGAETTYAMSSSLPTEDSNGELVKGNGSLGYQKGQERSALLARSLSRAAMYRRVPSLSDLPRMHGRFRLTANGSAKLESSNSDHSSLTESRSDDTERKVPPLQSRDGVNEEHMVPQTLPESTKPETPEEQVARLERYVEELEATNMQERERADHYLKLMQQVVSGTGIEVWGHEKVLAGPDRIVARAAELAHASQDAKVHMRLPHVSSSEHLDTAYHNSIANGASLWLKERAMNMLNEGITISDVRLPENPLIYANQAFYSMTGYTPEETLGRNCRFLQGQATDPGKVAELSRCIRNGEPCAVEILNYRKDGTPFVNYLSVTPIKDCIGKVTHYVGIQSDISELVGRKQAQRQATLAAEAAEASTAVKSRFLATMSHEIRTPLNGMIGVSQLLAATELTPEQKDYVSTVLTSSETLLSLVNDILDFSKIEADKLQLQYQDFNLAEVLDFAIDLAGLKASEKRINIVYSLPATVPRCVRGDPVRLQQVLLNIMNNAVKFTDAGEVEVTVSVSVAKEPSDRSPEKQGTSGTMTNTDPTSSGGSGSDNVGSVSSQREGGSATCTSAHKGASYVVLRFMVRDTGIGISEEGLSRLFLSFSQLDSTPTRRYGGSGLGLVISKRLCEVMGGSMWAESKGHGQGSTFTFTIKCAISENSPEVVVFQPGKVWCQTDTEKSKLTGKRIVLVEENEKVRLSLAAALTDRGADVLPMDSTSSVKAFLTSSGKEEVHAYVLGEECCEALKESVDVSKCIIMAWPGSEAAKSSQYFSVLQRPIKHLRFFHAVSTLMDGLQSAGANVPYALGSLSRTVDLTHKPSVETASDFAKRATRGSGSAAHAHTQGLEGICCSGRVVKGGCQEAKKQKLRLLVAEDHVVNLKVALGLLKKLGHTDVVVAHDGVEALERLKQDPQGAYGFDAILMDLNMPRMGGIEAVKEIIRLWPDAAGSGQRRGRVRIIAVTADALEETQTLCLRTGFDGWLPKPFRLVDLENALRTAGEP